MAASQPRSLQKCQVQQVLRCTGCRVPGRAHVHIAIAYAHSSANLSDMSGVASGCHWLVSPEMHAWASTNSCDQCEGPAG